MWEHVDTGSQGNHDIKITSNDPGNEFNCWRHQPQFLSMSAEPLRGRRSFQLVKPLVRPAWAGLEMADTGIGKGADEKDS